jgi:hypothetical protein
MFATHSSETMPDATIASQQDLRRPAARLHPRHSLHRCILLPGVKERLHRPPAVLDIVGALEQRLVAGQAVVDQVS